MVVDEKVKVDMFISYLKIFFDKVRLGWNFYWELYWFRFGIIFMLYFRNSL